MTNERTIDFDESTPIATRAFADIQKSLASGNFNSSVAVLRVLEAVKELEKIQFDYYRAMSGGNVADGEES